MSPERNALACHPVFMFRDKCIIVSFHACITRDALRIKADRMPDISLRRIDRRDPPGASCFGMAQRQRCPVVFVDVRVHHGLFVG